MSLFKPPLKFFRENGTFYVVSIIFFVLYTCIPENIVGAQFFHFTVILYWLNIISGFHITASHASPSGISGLCFAHRFDVENSAMKPYTLLSMTQQFLPLPPMPGTEKPQPNEAFLQFSHVEFLRTALEAVNEMFCALRPPSTRQHQCC